jgi:proteic killer suppression protein
VIKTFKDEQTRKIYYRQFSQKLPYDIQQVALRKLRMINNATSIDDLLALPANQLKKLDGKGEGLWSMRIDGQWHICFEWNGEEVHNVEILDSLRL